MVSPKFHLSYDDLFETVLPTAGNPPTYSNWQVLTGLRKHEQNVRETKDTASQRAERPEAVITRDTPNPKNMDREEKFTVEELPAAEEEIHPSEGYIILTLSQLPSQ